MSVKSDQSSTLKARISRTDFLNQSIADKRFINFRVQDIGL